MWKRVTRAVRTPFPGGVRQRLLEELTFSLRQEL